MSLFPSGHSTMIQYTLEAIGVHAEQLGTLHVDTRELLALPAGSPILDDRHNKWGHLTPSMVHHIRGLLSHPQLFVGGDFTPLVRCRGTPLLNSSVNPIAAPNSMDVVHVSRYASDLFDLGVLLRKWKHCNRAYHKALSRLKKKYTKELQKGGKS